MKLTTPATASAPYTDEAPPVSTSTRLISDDGMKLRSAAWVVLFGIARHQAAAVDQRQGALRAEVAKIDFGGAGRAVGHARGLRGADRRQLVEQILDAGRARQLESWLETTVTGAADVRFGCGMREPVTTMSWASRTGLALGGVAGVGWASTGPVGLADIDGRAVGRRIGRRGLSGAASCAKAGVARAATPTSSVVDEQALTEIELHKNLPLHLPSARHSRRTNGR